MTEKLHCKSDNALMFNRWINERGGLLVWQSIALDDPEITWTTPAKDPEGNPTTKPSHKASSSPIRTITDPNDVVVITPKEVKRFHVALRLGSQGLTMKVTDGGTRRIRAAVAKYSTDGDTAFYNFDYSTQEAVIYVSGPGIGLPEFIKEHEAWLESLPKKTHTKVS